jgi:hypothetical protein
VPSSPPTVSPTPAIPPSPLVYNNKTKNSNIKLYFPLFLILLIPPFFVCCYCYRHESFIGFKKIRLKERNSGILDVSDIELSDKERNMATFSDPPVDVSDIELSDESLLEIGLIDDDNMFTGAYLYVYIYMFINKYSNIYIYVYIL